MPKRRTHVPPSPIGDQLRRDAMAYKRPKDGLSHKEHILNEGRAEGLLDAANRIDLWLFKNKGGETFPMNVGDPVEVRGGPQAATQAGTIEDRMTALEESVGNLAALVASGAQAVMGTPMFAETDLSVPTAKPKARPSAVDKPNGHDAPSHGVLAVLAAAVVRPGVTSAELMAMLNYKETSIKTYVQEARSRGLVRTEGGKHYPATSPSAFPDLRLPTATPGKDLLAWWIDHLSAGPSKVLSILRQDHPSPVHTIELRSATGYETTSVKTFVGELAAHRLIVRPDRGVIALAPVVRP